LSKALQALIDNPEERKRLGKAARAWIERERTWKQVTRRYAAALQKVRSHSIKTATYGIGQETVKSIVQVISQDGLEATHAGKPVQSLGTVREIDGLVKKIPLTNQPEKVAVMDSIKCDIMEIFSKEITDGVYSINYKEQSVSFRASGFDESANIILVSFSGAIVKREGKKPPFFFGTNTAKSLGLPLISFTDPVFELDDDINLGWYAGINGFEEFPNVVAYILDGLAEKNGFRFIVFGGSGGGYATISICSRMRSKAIAFVWNPQTVISNYSESVVLKYVEVAFPSVYASLKGKVSCKKLIEETGVRNKIHADDVPDNIRLLYIQNYSDWHLNSHCKVFFSGKNMATACDAPVWKINNLVLGIGNWGNGHAAPNSILINAILSFLTSCFEDDADLAEIFYIKDVVEYFPSSLLNSVRFN
jgi:hypothetical protein